MRLSRVNHAGIRLAAVCLVILGGIVQLGERSNAAAVKETAQVSDGRQLLHLLRKLSWAFWRRQRPGRGRDASYTTGYHANCALQWRSVSRRTMRRIIDGRDIEAHGDRDMPVWGDSFKSDRGGHSDEFVRERIASILQYLISIQRRLA